MHRALLVLVREQRGGERLGDRADLEFGVRLGQAVVAGVAVEALRAHVTLRGADGKTDAGRCAHHHLVDEAAEVIRACRGCRGAGEACESERGAGDGQTSTANHVLPPLGVRKRVIK